MTFPGDPPPKRCGRGALAAREQRVQLFVGDSLLARAHITQRIVATVVELDIGHCLLFQAEPAPLDEHGVTIPVTLSAQPCPLRGSEHE